MSAIGTGPEVIAVRRLPSGGHALVAAHRPATEAAMSASPPVGVTIVAAEHSSAALGLPLPGPRFCPRSSNAGGVLHDGVRRVEVVQARSTCLVRAPYRDRDGLTFPTSSMLTPQVKPIRTSCSTQNQVEPSPAGVGPLRATPLHIQGHVPHKPVAQVQALCKFFSHMAFVPYHCTKSHTIVL